MGFIDETKIETRAFLNGMYTEGKKGAVMTKNSSVTGKKLVEITACDAEDVDFAVACAKKALEDGVWTGRTLGERKDVLLKLAGLMEEHREELARLDAYETGRAYKNYLYDSIPKSIEAIRYFAEAIDKIYDSAMNPGGHEMGLVMREPLGVVCGIVPWNDPMVVAAWKFAPALLMGNSVIMKPAEQSSLSLIRTAALAKEAGIPDGVFQVVTGYGETAGRALCLHMDVRGVFFTGSSAVGKQILQYSGMSNMKRVGLECGGKSPFVVSEKCKNLKRAAEVLAKNVFYNQGQICSASSRAIIHRSVRTEFLELLFAEADKYVPADPYRLENEIGCVVSREQYDKVLHYISVGKQEAENYYVAKGDTDLPKGACGIYPTIFYDVSPQSVIAQEEIFGPVLTVLEYDTIEEAVKIANDTKYGLAGAVFTDDLQEAYYVAKEIKSGIVHVNEYGDDNNMAPFGGMKESGMGKDKSVYAFDDYSELKTVWMRLG